MAFDAMKYVDTLVGIFVSLILFGAFFPQINTAITGLGLDNVTVAGTSYNFAWVGYLVVIGLMLGLAYLGISQIKAKK